jgi:hypothetical protein
VSGQSCGQAAWTVVIGEFIAELLHRRAARESGLGRSGPPRASGRD